MRGICVCPGCKGKWPTLCSPHQAESWPGSNEQTTHVWPQTFPSTNHPPFQERLPGDFQEHGAPETHLLTQSPNREVGRRDARWPPTGPVSLPV